MVLQGDRFYRETGFAGGPVPQGNRFRRETGFTGRLVSEGKRSLVTLAKIFMW